MCFNFVIIAENSFWSLILYKKSDQISNASFFFNWLVLFNKSNLFYWNKILNKSFKNVIGSRKKKRFIHFISTRCYYFVYEKIIEILLEFSLFVGFYWARKWAVSLQMPFRISKIWVNNSTWYNLKFCIKYQYSLPFKTKNAMKCVSGLRSCIKFY